MQLESILATDGYKFSMAAAGFPLRRETFYYSHRKGGPHYLPFDVEKVIRGLLPTKMPTELEREFLIESGYDMGGAYWTAMKGELEIKALPKGSWFFDREPAFTVTGPSALVSWLEPLVLQLHWRIQLATLAKRGELPGTITVTCQEQRDIAREVFDAIGERNWSDAVVNRKNYHAHVKSRVAELIQIVENPTRIFEVGMRAATCMEQHQFALEAAMEAGLLATSNVQLAFEYQLKAVGTMGHEHVQRFGNDEAAFRAMRDRHPGPTSFLLDTFSTIHSGLPTAFDLIAEDPSRGDTVRFDSGDKETQFLIACSMARHRGIKPRFILEDGFTAEMTRTFPRPRGRRVEGDAERAEPDHEVRRRAGVGQGVHPRQARPVPGLRRRAGHQQLARPGRPRGRVPRPHPRRGGAHQPVPQRLLLEPSSAVLGR
jgi:nicotinic acid phosphoribosyltransferase